MKAKIKIRLISSWMLFSMQGLAQYTHPTVGIQSEFVGSCLVADCGPVSYYDNVGPGGDYSNNINFIYRVFCPSVAGNCMRVTFNSFDVQPQGGWPFFCME
jgi:hypothetical protein